MLRTTHPLVNPRKVLIQTTVPRILTVCFGKLSSSRIFHCHCLTVAPVELTSILLPLSTTFEVSCPLALLRCITRETGPSTMSGLLPYGECIAPYVYTPLNGSIYPTSKEFEHIVEGLSDALDFSRTIGIESMPPYEQGGAREAVGEVDFYTSHEGLMLDYEQALTREFPLPPSLATKDKKKAYYNAGAHFLWIGDSTLR